VSDQTRIRSARAAAEAVNRERQAAAAARDTPLAQAIALSAVWPELGEGRRQVVAVRAAHPAASWAEIGAITGMTKDAAYGLWRQVRRLPAVQALHKENGGG
jgi:hypothetical protein